MRLILLGAPGAGKGTQGALLAKHHGILRISTGDLLRDAVRKGTPLGCQAREYMDAGELVPDHLILEMVRKVITEEATDGFVLDGFPRTVDQAEGLQAMLDELGLGMDAVLVLEVPDEVLVKRISGRRSCPACNAVYNVYFDPPEETGVCDRCGARLEQRKDDDPATVLRRIEVYRNRTRPVIEYYEEAPVPIVEIDGVQPVEDVQADIAEELAVA
ncbi:MAG: adenylate kinase [Gemmatimonadota bacterium]